MLACFVIYCSPASLASNKNLSFLGIFAYVGNSGGDVQENWCSRCFGGRRLQQPKLPMVYILESPAFSLQSDGELLVEMYRNSAMANAITLQVCILSDHNSNLNLNTLSWVNIKGKTFYFLEQIPKFCIVKNNSFILQVCFDSMQNCTFVGSPCQLNCRQPAQFLPNGWTRESVRLPFATKKVPLSFFFQK